MEDMNNPSNQNHSLLFGLPVSLMAKKCIWIFYSTEKQVQPTQQHQGTMTEYYPEMMCKIARIIGLIFGKIF